MDSEIKPVMICLSNLCAFIGIAGGYWFAHVGMGFGRGSSVDGDAIFGGMLLICGLFLSIVFLIIGLLRREGPWFFYIFPVIAVIAFSVRFYILDKEVTGAMKRANKHYSYKVGRSEDR